MFEKIKGLEHDILNELEYYERLTYEQLAYTLSVSKSTIRRAISRLEQIYPIIKFQGKYGGIELDKHLYGLPNKIRSMILQYLKILENINQTDKNLKKCISYLDNKSNTKN